VSSVDRLLVVQGHDTAADQLRHRRVAMPERADLQAVEDGLAALEATAAEVGVRRDDVARRQQRLEDEVASIEAKVTELDKRLYSGAISSPRELQALQADIDSLKRHRSDLEDGILVAMEQREPLDAELAALDEERARLDRAAGQFRATIAEAEVEIDRELETVEDLRREAAAGLPADLTELYDQLRAKLGGVAAARLEPGGRCGGCHLTLPATEVARIKRESADMIFRCDQCGRILIRTDEG